MHTRMFGHSHVKVCLLEKENNPEHLHSLGLSPTPSGMAKQPTIHLSKLLLSLLDKSDIIELLNNTTLCANWSLSSGVLRS